MPNLAAAVDAAGSSVVTLAELCRTKLYLMHVIENPTSSIYGEVDGDYLAMETNAREKARAWLHDAARGLSDLPDTEVLLREGEVLSEILKVEEDKAIGTIVGMLLSPVSQIISGLTGPISQVASQIESKTKEEPPPA